MRQYNWCRAEEIKRVLHTISDGTNARWKALGDDVRNTQDSDSKVGIVEALFIVAWKPEVCFALLRRLVDSKPAQGNKAVVTVFGNSRYKYMIGTNRQIGVDCVPLAMVSNPVMILPDPYDISRRYGADIRIREAQYKKNDHKLAQVFHIASYRYTLVGETFC